MTDSCQAILVRLNSGDEGAIERMFVAFEPYMRMAIHRRISGSLRAKFDSADIVQSVWADLVDGLCISASPVQMVLHERRSEPKNAPRDPNRLFP